MVAKIKLHPAFDRRLRHYRDRIGIRDERPQVAKKFVKAVDEAVTQLMKNPQRGHSARFESSDLADILRIAVPGFPVFAVFYRWNNQLLTIITIEHTAQDLPERLATIVSRG